MAEGALDVLDLRPLDTEGCGIVLRIHLERASHKPHHIRLPLGQPTRKEHWEDLAHEPGHFLSEECTKQLDEHLAGARVDRRRRLLHTA